MKKIIRHHRLTIIVVLLVLAVTIATGLFFWFRQLKTATLPSQSAPMRIPVDVWPGNFWTLVADANGYFKEEGLSVELIDVTADYFGWIDSLVTGGIDTMELSPFDVVQKNIEGANLVIVWQSDMSEGAEGILAKPGIDTITQLRGKKIGVEKDTYLDYFLDTALLTNGISKTDLTLVDMKTDDLDRLYPTTDLDAIVIWEPDLSQNAQEYGGSKIFDTSKIKGFSPTVFAFRREFLDRNPEEVRRLLRAWEKATNYIKAHTSEAIDLISRHSFDSEEGSLYTHEEIQKLMDDDPISDLDENMRALRFSSGFDSLLGNLQYVYRYFQRSSKSTPEMDVDKMIDTRFIHNFH